MTKRHFDAVAKIIAYEMIRVNHKDNPDSRTDSIKTIAIDLARNFNGFNERFDKGLFLRACGMDTQTILEG
jgi:hypothetical protein